MYIREHFGEIDIFGVKVGIFGVEIEQLSVGIKISTLEI